MAAFVLNACSHVPSPAQEPTAALSGADFNWLTGCWVQQRSATLQIEEQWMAPVAQGIAGVSRTTKAGKVVSEELMHIYTSPRKEFVATIPGQTDTPFALIRYRAASEPLGAYAVFENPSHDFPQRVIYQQQHASQLIARIEGRLEGEEKAEDFLYNRVDCAGQR